MKETKNEKYSSLNDKENHIALMNLYRDEWKYRDQMFFSLFWRFTYLSLIITFLPNFLEAASVKNSFAFNLPVGLFSIAGILCATFGLYIELAENERIKKIDLAYRKIEKDLPEKYRTERIEKKFFQTRYNIWLCFGMYSVMVLLAIINVLFNLSV